MSDLFHEHDHEWPFFFFAIRSSVITRPCCISYFFSSFCCLSWNVCISNEIFLFKSVSGLSGRWKSLLDVPDVVSNVLSVSLCFQANFAWYWKFWDVTCKINIARKLTTVSETQRWEKFNMDVRSIYTEKANAIAGNTELSNTLYADTWEKWRAANPTCLLDSWS